MSKYFTIAARLTVYMLIIIAVTPFHAFGRHVALCIGVDDYGPQQSLRYAVSDADALARRLEHRGFDEVITLKNSEAKRDDILAAIQSVTDEASSDDVVVVFFAGHGRQVADEKGQIRSYLVPYACPLDEAAERGLSVRALTDLLMLSDSKVVLLLDACHSGEEMKSVASSAPRAYSDLRVLAACQQSEYAFERKGHGLFTLEILHALDVSGSVQGKPVDFDKLAQSVAQRISSATGSWQRPQYTRMDLESAVVMM